MKLELHPDARANFDNEAGELLPTLSPPSPNQSAANSGGSFRPDVIPKMTIPAEDIHGLTHQTVDPVGRILTRYFTHKGKEIGLGQDSYRQLVRLCEKTHKSIRDFVSYSTVENEAFNWVIARYKGETNDAMTEYILTKVEAALAEFTVWIPVAALYIQSEIPIGKVVLRPFRPEVFDQFGAYKRTDNPERAAQMDDWILGLKQKYQGRVAVTLTGFGEEKRVVEIAQEQGERALAMLRFFSAGAIIPGKVSYCRLEGRENIEKSIYFAASDGRAGYGDGGIDPGFDIWTLPDKQIDFMNKNGLQVLSDLLNLEKPSQFQQALLDSLFAYSRSTLAKELSDKLLYLFTGLDSFLLKGENEPIQQNISERLACVVGSNVPERRRIIQVVKEMYARRSKFVHHNQQQVDDLDMMAEFLLIVWKFYVQVIHSHGRFKTKAEFIASLEDRRLSY